MPVGFEPETESLLNKQRRDDQAVIEAAKLLERLGFSNQSAEQAAGQIAVDQYDLKHLANLLEYRHTADPAMAKEFAGEMLDRGPDNRGTPKGWDMYVRPEVLSAENAPKPLAMEDPLVNYVTSPEYTAGAAKGKEAKAEFARQTARPNPYDDKLAKAAALRQKILGY